jgi:hypothetical protein
MGDFPWSPEGRWYWARRNQKLFWFSVDSARLKLVWSFGIQKGLRVEKQHVSSMISFHTYLGCQHNSEDTAMMTRRRVPSAMWRDRRHGCHRMIFWQPLITGAAVFQGVSLAFGGPLCTEGWESKSSVCVLASCMTHIWAACFECTNGIPTWWLHFDVQHVQACHIEALWRFWGEWSMQLSKSKLTFAQRFAQALLLRNQNQCTTTNHKFPHMDFDVWLVTSLCVHVLSLSTHTNRDLKVAISSTCHSFRSKCAPFKLVLFSMFHRDQRQMGLFDSMDSKCWSQLSLFMFSIALPMFGQN